MISRRTLVGNAAALAVLPFVHGASRAQTPAKPIRFVVGFPAGGGTDIIARMIAEQMRGRISAPAIVENKPGAAGRLAIDSVKNAEPDGSVVLFTPDFPMTVYPHSFRSLNYDPVRDFAPVAIAATSILTFSVGPAVPRDVRSAKDYLAWCAANSAKATFGTTSAGGTPHFVGVMLAGASGVPLSPVHYRGGAPALQDLLGGHIPAAVNPISEMLPYAKSDSIRILAVTGAQRLPFLPDVPTMQEAGFPIVVESWLGFFAPAKTPEPIVQALSDAFRQAVTSKEVNDGLMKIGNYPYYRGPAEFRAVVQADIQRWAPVVKASGFVAED